MQGYRTVKRGRLGALGLVPNAAVLCTTRHLAAAVEELRTLPADEREHGVLDDNVARVSPVKHANRNMLGRYGFRAFPLDGGLRPLRDPGAGGLN
ncbi:transposase [Streptomyces hilarionis]|uniref:transposase n=1 Tax=Streptomyces hilarionis TaxID=2839954 RepID=UPI00211A1BD9|nr:transposase [Streptomyces hilarionis]MCQ9131166.1 transposase [Streptomyces hilarionis]